MRNRHHDLMGSTDQLQEATKHYKSFKHKLILCTQNTDTQLIQAFHIQSCSCCYYKLGLL